MPIKAEPATDDDDF